MEMARKILIIDDDIELLKMLKKYFTLNATDPYEIITAQNGMEGLDKINAQPDLILLDINMPTIDGIEVCQKIREQVNCPIIFLTARVEEQDIVNGLSVVTVKPFGIGRPRLVISARFAPLPPKRFLMSALPSSKRYTHFAIENPLSS